MDFVVDAGARLELFEAKWTELQDLGDTVNLEFVRNEIGKSRVTAGGIVSRNLNSFPFSNGFRAVPVTELGIWTPPSMPLCGKQEERFFHD